MGESYSTQIMSGGKGQGRRVHAEPRTAKYRSFHQEVSSPKGGVTQFVPNNELHEDLKAGGLKTTRNRSQKDYFLSGFRDSKPNLNSTTN